MRPAAAGLTGVIVLATIVGLAAHAVLRTSDHLRADIVATLESFRPVEKAAQESSLGSGISFVITCGVPTDAVRGYQIAFLGVLFGGTPSALAGLFLGWRRRLSPAAWSAWSPYVFLTGLWFQLCNLLLVSLLLALVVSVMAVSGRETLEPKGLLLTAGLLIDGGLGAFALRSWRFLQTTTPSDIQHLAL